MDEKIETRPEVMVKEQAKAGFLSKIKLHKFKILGGVLGILVFAGAVFGAYKLGQRQIRPGLQPTPTPEVVATPTPDPTADWQTYTNTKYGYLVKYPANWVFREIKYESTPYDTVPSFIGVGFRPAEPELTDKEFTVINVETLNNPDKLSLEDFFRKWDYRCCGPGAESTELPNAVKTAEEITVGELQGKKIINPPIDTAGLPVTWVLIEQDDKIFRFRVTLDKSYPKIDKERIFNLMLSTFRFLEESAYKCVEESSLNCAEEIELSFQCTEEYQSWARENCPGWKKYVYCEDPRPEVCTMECIVNPPYICGSDGKSYCSECQACATPIVEWYIIQDTPCKP